MPPRRLSRLLRAQLFAKARQMRAQPTEAEAALWERLRNRQLAGLRFKRQQRIDHFIADFFCSEARLVVELDGAVHRRQRERDEARAAYLHAAGLRVLRFSNDRVAQDLERVLREIAQAAAEPPSPRA